MTAGDERQIIATVLPEDSGDKTVTWSSSDHTIVEVNAITGSVRALAPGQANIIATTKEGGKKATMLITVVRPKMPIEYVAEFDVNKAGNGFCVSNTDTYEPIEAGEFASRMEITVRYLGRDFTGTLDTISNDDWWESNNHDNVVRVLPASGYKTSRTATLSNVGKSGHHGCTTTSSSSYYYYYFNKNGSQINDYYNKVCYAVRLISDDNL